MILSAQPDIESDKASEDLGSLFFDADGDGDADLYVVSGGSEFPKGSVNLRDRLYLNDGRGRFKRSADALPDLRRSGSRVRAADIDEEGGKATLAQVQALGGRGCFAQANMAQAEDIE